MGSLIGFLEGLGYTPGTPDFVNAYTKASGINYVAIPDEDDPNKVMIVDKANPGNSFYIDLNTAWQSNFDMVDQAAIEVALRQSPQPAQREYVDPRREDSGGGQDPGPLTGKKAFDAGFKAYSPTGFKASGGWGTQGAAWDSWSPSGWNSPGGWDPNPNHLSQGFTSPNTGQPISNAELAYAMGDLKRYQEFQKLHGHEG